MANAYVAFVWHMHQPCYLWPNSQAAALPFARLHSSAAYYDMPWLLRQFSDTRVTFNLVPSLVAQIQGYASGEITDRAQELSLRDPADLSLDDRRYLLIHMCGGQPVGTLAVSPRYGELSHKRGMDRNPEAIDRACRLFREDELRDLQVLFNLAWCGYALDHESDTVRELRRKDRNFTEDDKRALLGEMKAAAGRVLDLYRQVSAEGRAELVCSPFYHPIMPLLVNMQDAVRRIPLSQLPEDPWREPEEARRQLREGLDAHADVFGARPRGIWPPEGAVSDAALSLVADEGVEWAASDEEVLAASLVDRERLSPGELYRPWVVPDGRLSLIFRDHRLADLIGFVYRDWKPADAAANFVGRLRAAAESAGRTGRPPLVSIILDGENPWGWYHDVGEGFLRELYRRIEADSTLETTTVSGYLDRFPATDRLASVFPGSWIDHSFSTWIGGQEHYRAWRLLTGALEAVKRAGPGASGYEAARRHLMVAEGSDWFWWYSENQHSADADVFDALFRGRVAAVYGALGKEPPREVEEPIYAARVSRLSREAVGRMRAHIDGRVSSYFEWQPAALLRTAGLASAMQRSDFTVHEVYFGFGDDALWLRVDADGQASEWLNDCTLEIMFAGATEHVISVAIEDGGGTAKLDGEVCADGQCAVGRVIEAMLPLRLLDAGPGGTLRVAVLVGSEGRIIERWPELGYLDVHIPTEEAMAADWLV